MRSAAIRQKRFSYVYQKEKEAGISLLTILTVFYIFVGVLTCLTLHTVTNSKQSKLLLTQNELKNLKESNTSLAADISASYDLDEIERIATTKLGMSEPKPHQIIYISVPKQSHVVQNERTKTAKTDNIGFFKRLMAIIIKE